MTFEFIGLVSEEVDLFGKALLSRKANTISKVVPVCNNCGKKHRCNHSAP